MSVDLQVASEGGPAWDPGDVDERTGEVREGFFRCENPSRYAGWLVEDGRVIPARCGATNRCAFCAYQMVMENALVVSMDAERGAFPRVGMTLTTVDPHHSMAAFRKDVEQVFRSVRRRCGDDAAYLGMIEHTTGRGAKSGGHRRVHQHALLKNVLPSEVDALEGDVRRVWEQRTGASRVDLRELRSPAGAVAYLIHHHHKRDQAPPPGWKGKRMRPSKNYYSVPVPQLRREARELLRSKRVRKVARQLMAWDELDGAPEELLDAEWSAALGEARAAAEMVTFVKLDRHGAIKSPPSRQPHVQRRAA